MAYGVVNADKLSGSNGGSISPDSSVFRNRIINGAMVIDQRNAGASVSITTDAKNYVMDRFWAYDNTDGDFSLQQVSDAPAGFINSAKVTITTADASIGSGQYAGFSQLVEGLNSADLAWGTASASTVTLSFWVKSSLTGTFGGSLRNNAADRSYPFSYSISLANTWEQKSIIIVGDTTGTWLTTNGIGIRVNWSLADGSSRVGTAGSWVAASYGGATGQTQISSTLNATWQITGVQLEKGSTATSFDYRPYGTELVLCQRYFETSYPAGATIPTALANGWSSTTLQNIAEGPSGVIFKVTKRANPTMVMYNAVNGASGAMYRASDAASISTTFDYIGVNQVGLVRPASSSANSYYIHWTASVEL